MTRRWVEIRSYNLKPGSRPIFHQLFTSQSLPLLQRWKVDVVSFGASPHDETSYFLMRSYADLGERQRSQDAFYGSDDWQKGPREAILALIETQTSIVIEVDEATLFALRQVSGGLPGTR